MFLNFSELWKSRKKGETLTTEVWPLECRFNLRKSGLILLHIGSGWVEKEDFMTWAINLNAKNRVKIFSNVALFINR